MCQFLLSDERVWVTGHIFNVDGGQVDAGVKVP